MILTWLHLQGVSHKGYVSKPPIPEEREANRQRDEAAKKKKDAAKETAARKRRRKEEYAKACKIVLAEGAPCPVTPESTEEEDPSDGGLNFSESDCDEVVTGTSFPPAYLRADGVGSSVVLGEARLTPGSLVEPYATRAERRSPAPVAGQRLPASAVGWRSTTPVMG